MSSPSHTKQGNLLVPLDRPSSAGSVGKRKKQKKDNLKKGSPIMSKVTGFFKRDKNKEEGEVHVKPRCFVDEPQDRRHSESPEPSERSSSVGSKHPFKLRVKGTKDESKHSGPMWRVKGRLEWESDSGRQLSITDVPVSELSKVEVEGLQRQAVTALQSMDIPVSHGILKGSRNKVQVRSFNTFNKKKVNVTEKPGDRLSTGGEQVIFGQPLTSVLSKDPPRSSSAACTPVPSTPTNTFPRTLHPPSLSPTSTTSSETSIFDEVNATSMLLEALSVNATPSPRSKRRQSLCPADRQVPSIVTKAIDYLDTKGVKTEGLFRISGAKSRINEIREMFDSGQDVELTDDMNPHDVACLLKEFFRSLPEPLLTRELYQPFLSTRKLSNSAQRRDALRLLCLLLPHVNRDTLQELLQFLSRVALHSNGIILIDGTEETGNLMTEQNLALIIGPNILHKELKKKGEFLMQKLDQEELQSVCKVMEDLIRMQTSIFTIPAQLYDTTLRQLSSSDPEALDQLLKRRCYQQGLFLDHESPCGTLMVSRSRSTEALRKISVHSNGSLLTIDGLEPDFLWRRSRSLSDTQQCLDEALKSLEQEIADDLTYYQTTLDEGGRYSSNDSAMGESEHIVSPLQSASEPSTLNRKRDVFVRRDSAFSYTSSPTNSSEGMNNSDILSMESDSPFIHTRMSSGISGLSALSNMSGVSRGDSDSPPPGADSPEQASSPQLDRKGPFCKTGSSSSLPAMNGGPRRMSPYHIQQTNTMSNEDYSVRMANRQAHTLPSALATHSIATKKEKIKKHRKKVKHVPSVSSSGTYSHQRSPILNAKDHKYHSETQLHILSCDHTPTESSSNIASSPSVYSLDSGNYHSHTEGTVI